MNNRYVGSDFIVRHAVPLDAHGIQRTRILTWRQAYWDIVDRDFLTSLDIEDASERARQRMTDELLGIVPPNFRLVAELEGEVVGFCVCGVKPDAPLEGTWFMYALYVHPEHQGKGIGKALLETVKKEGRRRRHSRMTFGVFSDNEASKKFYFAQGARFLEKGDYELDGVAYSTDYCEFDI